jgi:ribosomal protein L11 methyltransferase
LCLAGLQQVPLEGRSMLDVGTGSGVLAFAARAMGASSAVGIDNDPDAVQNARENELLNPTLDRVSFRLCELGRDPLPPADVVTANLTGASLCRTAGLLLGATGPGGHLIVSGLLITERADVQQAFGLLPVWEAFEDEWAVMCFTSPDSR